MSSCADGTPRPVPAGCVGFRCKGFGFLNLAMVLFCRRRIGAPVHIDSGNVWESSIVSRKSGLKTGKRPTNSCPAACMATTGRASPP
jgi:hypothetical protein